MAHKIALVTDSSCNIPDEWLKQYDITVVPLPIKLGNQQFLEGVDISPQEFYDRVIKERLHPATSQPVPGAFLKVYQQVAVGGAEEILVITLSGAMSGTFASAKQAGSESGIPVHVMDSRNNSMGVGWQVIAAARAREAGGGLEAMMAVAAQVRDDMVYYVSLDTIEFLSRGGRISEAVRFLDSILQIKPLVYLRPDTGTVGASLPARSRKSALEGLYKEFFRHIDHTRPMHIAVMHTNALQEAQEMAERVQREYAPKEMFITIGTPVVGTHSGPRAVALCGYAER